MTSCVLTSSYIGFVHLRIRFHSSVDHDKWCSVHCLRKFLYPAVRCGSTMLYCVCNSYNEVNSLFVLLLLPIQKTRATQAQVSSFDGLHGMNKRTLRVGLHGHCWEVMVYPLNQPILNFSLSSCCTLVIWWPLIFLQFADKLNLNLEGSGS